MAEPGAEKVPVTVWLSVRWASETPTCMAQCHPVWTVKRVMGNQANDRSLYLTVLFCEDLVHTITNCVKQTNKKARKEVMQGFISVFLRYSLMALNFTHFPGRLWFWVSSAAGVCAHPTAGGGCEVRLGMWWPQCPCVSLSPSPVTHGAPAAVEVKVWCDVMSQAW